MINLFEFAKRNGVGISIEPDDCMIDAYRVRVRRMHIETQMVISEDVLYTQNELGYNVVLESLLNNMVQHVEELWDAMIKQYRRK